MKSVLRAAAAPCLFLPLLLGPTRYATAAGPVVRVSPAVAFWEGDAAGTAKVAVWAEPAPARDLTVHYVVTDALAPPGAPPVKEGDVTIPAGSAARAYATFPLAGDRAAGPDRRYKVKWSLAGPPRSSRAAAAVLRASLAQEPPDPNDPILASDTTPVTVIDDDGQPDPARPVMVFAASGTQIYRESDDPARPTTVPVTVYLTRPEPNHTVYGWVMAFDHGGWEGVGLGRGGVDYQPINVAVAFPPGSTTATVNLTLLGVPGKQGRRAVGVRVWRGIWAFTGPADGTIVFED